MTTRANFGYGQDEEDGQERRLQRVNVEDPDLYAGEEGEQGRHPDIGKAGGVRPRA